MTFSSKKTPRTRIVFSGLSRAAATLAATLLLTTGIAAAQEGSASAQQQGPESLAATGLSFVGFISYTYSGNTARLMADRVRNSRSFGTSGPLRMSLWATTDPPVFGQTITGFMTASYVLGQLSSGSSFVNIDSGLVTFSRPPTGTYYFTMLLEELQSGSYSYQDFVITSPLQSFGGSFPICTANATTQCLNGGRFIVSVGWQALNLGTSGSGQAVRLTTDTGYFWFFSSNNIELVIKVVDGRPVNGKFWVFYGALTDVQYTITIADTVTGVVRTYFNQQSNLASVADTLAF